MKNNNLRGAGTVFRYTMQQHYKTRSVIIFLLILFLIAVSAMPIAALVSGNSKEISETGIQTLYLRNETGFPIDDSDILANERYGKLKILQTDEDDDALTKHLISESGAAVSVISLDAENYCFSVNTRYGKEGNVSHADAATLNNVLEEVLHKSLMKGLSVTEAQEATIRSQAVSQVSKVSDFLRGAEETNVDTHTFISMFYSIFIYMLASLSMAYIFQQCMEEKTSKLVEMLMVSLSPTALLLGKLLAVTAFIFIGIGLVIAGLLISVVITGQITDMSTAKEMLSSLLRFDPTSLHLSAGTIILFVLCILLVYSICAALSATVGSCCSKTEDTQQASLVVVLFLMVGYLTGFIAPLFESDGANIFFSVFPLTSIFCALPNYVCGKIGLPVLLLGMALQAVTAALMMRLAGTVYKMMLLYRGGVPKPKQLLQMLKEYRASAKANAGKEDSHAV